MPAASSAQKRTDREGKMQPRIRTSHDGAGAGAGGGGRVSLPQRTLQSGKERNKKTEIPVLDGIGSAMGISKRLTRKVSTLTNKNPGVNQGKDGVQKEHSTKREESAYAKCPEARTESFERDYK